MQEIKYKLSSLFLFFTMFLMFSCSDTQETGNLSDDGSRELSEVELNGRKVYRTYCLACHQKDGSGVRNMYPPVRESDWVEGDVKRLVDLIVNGLSGPIVVNGEEYNGVMPAQDYLTDDQIAAVLTYMRLNMGNKASEVTTEEVNRIRQEL
ncbi:MAG: cytochrome c [Cyclobacteriaceae bacterium]|nr:cytochrome c [Cyclobacteriaceae bacterium]MCH8517918.1 cytochrome c [Cyclobacteriaceae bacterium]